MMNDKKFDFPTVRLYVLFTLSALCLRFVLPQNEPFHIALFYAACAAGFSPFWTSLSFFGTSLIFSSPVGVLLSAAQALLLAVGFLFNAQCVKNGWKAAWLPPYAALVFDLALFVAFAPFTAYALPFTFINTPMIQKTGIAAAIFLLSAVFTVAVKAVTRKFLKCRLRGDELVFSALFFVFTGVGICRFFGFNAYMGSAFLVLLLFACATKDTSVFVCAFVLAIPPLVTLGLSPERFFFYACAIALFTRQGRLSAACAFLCAFFVYAYIDGLFLLPAAALIPTLLSALLPALIFVLIPVPVIRSLENKLIFYREKHLSRVAINRNRAAIGAQLFEISAVFREIQSTFSALSVSDSENGVREYIRACVTEESCKVCPRYQECAKKDVAQDLEKLVEIGCLKGKVNLIDLPKNLSDICVNQSNILYAVNRQLGDYRKYVLDAENAASGRTLLARQAQGVSEILRNLALEQSEPLRIYTEKERALNTALLGAGVVCSEVLLMGDEENPLLSLVTYGKADVKKIAAVASYTLNATMIISERLTLGMDKFCCILRKKPRFDAAFGVASAKKADSEQNGDTHSVVKIDERRFLVALSDGMGSGEYARRVSESTVCLLESFYRAKMPPETVLSTVNKLLAFSKEETFACVDIAVVDLFDGKTDIVKIGSPVGFILSGNTIKVLDSGSLPLGILDSLRPDTASYDLEENDTLLFISDGISQAFGSTTDLYNVLKGIPTGNPQQLADVLLQAAIDAYGGVAKDDMTALAVRLFKAA